MPKLVIHEYQRTAQYFREDLGNDIQLDIDVDSWWHFCHGFTGRREG
ncbi:hypothetical protein [Cylindrospermopsis raciborskii]|nr:hypothetical protein [Cylindrospermopsis raciborskii]